MVLGSYVVKTPKKNVFGFVLSGRFIGIDFRGTSVPTQLASRGTPFQRFIASPAHTVVRINKHEVGENRTRAPSFMGGYVSLLTFLLRRRFFQTSERALWRQYEWLQWYALISHIFFTSPWQGACLGDQFTESAGFNDVENFNMEVVQPHPLAYIGLFLSKNFWSIIEEFFF